MPKAEVGTWVTMEPKERWRGRHGRIVKCYSLTDDFVVVTDGSLGCDCCRCNFTVNRRQEPPHPFFPMRRKLPYGRYFPSEGGFVFYNRDYQPILRVHADGRREACDPHEWIVHERQEWFYDDGLVPWQSPRLAKRLTAILAGGPIFAAEITSTNTDQVGPYRFCDPYDDPLAVFAQQSEPAAA